MEQKTKNQTISKKGFVVFKMTNTDKLYYINDKGEYIHIPNGIDGLKSYREIIARTAKQYTNRFYKNQLIKKLHSYNRTQPNEKFPFETPNGQKDTIRATEWIYTERFLANRDYPLSIIHKKIK